MRGWGRPVTAVATRLKPAAQTTFPHWPASWGVRPKYVTLPHPERPTFGPKIQRIAERLGGRMFPWQDYTTACATEQIPDGLGGFEPAYDMVIILVTRRGGKTFMVKATTTERGLRDKARIAYTAQTRLEAQRRWLEVSDNKSHLEPERGLKQLLDSGVHVTTGVGNELLTFRATGSEFFPFAPNENAGHGGAYDLVFVDELWAHSLVTKQLIQQGYRPMWSVKPGQEWLMSAAGTHASSWLHEVRRLGRQSVNDPESRIFYIEFGIPDEYDVRALPDSELVRLTLEHHPRRGFGLREGYLKGELAQLGRSGFLRAYANIDAEDDAGGILADEIWKRQSAEARIPRGASVSVGIALDDQRRESTVALAWPRDDGTVVVESKTSPGVRWVAAYVAAAPNVVNVAGINTRLGRGCLDELERLWAEDLDAEPSPVLRVSQADAIAAASGWLASVEEDGATFFEPSQHLKVALASADLPVGGVWVSRNGEPITAVQAHTMAVWASGHREPETSSEFWVY